MAPRKTAKITPMAMMSGVTRKLNEVSLKVMKLPRPVVMLFSGRTSRASDEAADSGQQQRFHEEAE